MKRLAVDRVPAPRRARCPVEAGPLPKPISPVERHRTANFTHYVRGAGQTAAGGDSAWSPATGTATIRQTHAVRAGK